jgi:hypothetical protein
MVKTVKLFYLSITLFAGFINVCICQTTNDLVFGKVSNEDVIESIQFVDSLSRTSDVFRIDNVNSGEPFLIIVSTAKVKSVVDFREPDTLKVDQKTMNFLEAYIKENDTRITKRPQGYGTYRIVFRFNNRIGGYFIRGGGESYYYFLNWKNLISPNSEANKTLIRRISEIVSQVKTRN